MRVPLLVLVSLFAVAALAQQPAQVSEKIEVTATRIEEDLLAVPSTITVIGGEELRRTNARDLPSALALAGGISVVPGGDAGPAGSVPELWGLREVDAFLLVVDGVPWGGAFNPQSEAVDLHDVDRIEIVRGSAPVVYGATAFSGVIQVIHNHPGEAPGSATLSGGSFGSATAALVTKNLEADVDRDRFRDPRTSADRGHLLWRAEHQTASGRWRFDVDALRLLQNPGSPRPRDEVNVDLDTNDNPHGAHIDSTRAAMTAGYDSTIGRAPWTTTLSLTRTTGNQLRGFFDQDLGGIGFSQQRRITDVYFESHVAPSISRALRLIAGVDVLGGIATAGSQPFTFDPGTQVRTPQDANSLRDRRLFTAGYVQGEWTPSDAWRVDAGARLNHARERRATRDPDGSDADARTTTRGSGLLGVSHRVAERVWAFADYRNSFKPAALDLGPDAQTDVLRPETSTSYEIGVKSDRGRVFWQVSAFSMNLKNLVVADEASGLPALENSGSQRFRGAEAESRIDAGAGVHLFGSVAYHDARFVDFVQNFDGVDVQLRGNRPELAARVLAKAGATFSTGAWRGSLVLDHVGSRFLDRRNSILASPYTTIDAGVGRVSSWGELRIDGRNLTDRRPPVVESELGDAQFYLMPSRSLRLSYTRRF